MLLKKKMLLIILFLQLSACSPFIKQSILINSPCNLPCWQSVTPGQTTKQELLDALQKLPFVDKRSIVISDHDYGEFYNGSVYFSLFPSFIKWVQPLVTVQARLQNDTVVLMYFSGEINVNFNEVIQQVGNPDGVIVNLYMDGKPVLDLINANQGVGFVYNGDNGLTISPRSKLYAVVLFDPRVFEKILNARYFSFGNYDAQQTREIMYPWLGYGKIATLYPYRTPTP